MTPIYFLASRTLDSFSDDDHHDHMAVVRVGSPAVMDRTDDVGKLQCSPFLLPFPSSFRSRVWSRAAKGSTLCGLSLTLLLTFRHRIPARAPPSRPHPSSDLLACTSRTTCVTRLIRRVFTSIQLIPLVLAHMPFQTCLNFNAIYIVYPLNWSFQIVPDPEFSILVSGSLEPLHASRAVRD